MLTLLASKGSKIFAGVVTGMVLSGVGGYLAVSRLAPPPRTEAPAAAPLAEGARVAGRAAPTGGASAPDAMEAARDPAPSPASARPAPSFDVVRIEEDGAAILAGRAAPGATVEVLLDGAVIATVEASPSGEFLAMTETGPAPPGAARELTLRAEDAEGALVSEQSVLVLPEGAGPSAAGDAPAAATAGAAPGARPIPAAEPAAEPGIEPATGIAVADAPADDAGDPAVETEAAPFETARPAGGGAAADAPELAADASAPASGEAGTGAEASAAAPVLLRAGPEGVEVIQPPAARPGAVTLDAVTYSSEGDVVVSGRGAPGGTARVYADGFRLGDAPIGAQGAWEVTLHDLDRPGEYTLRVDEIDDAGGVRSRVESPFLREDAEIVARDAGRVVVQPGHNLWRIAEARYGEGTRYTVIYSANKDRIRDPDLIYPGQIFDLPD